MSHFIFVRHGQSKANANTEIADSHSPLTENGIEQARRTGKEVKDLGISLILCSPFLRAQQTAETIAGEIGLDITQIKIVDDLRERGLGVLEGRHRDHDGLWYFTDETSENVESREELLRRMKECLEVIEQYSKTNTVLVSGHSISGFYLQQAAKKRKLKDFDPPELMSNADFVNVEF